MGAIRAEILTIFLLSLALSATLASNLTGKASQAGVSLRDQSYLSYERIGNNVGIQVENSSTIFIRNDGSIDPPSAPISTSDNVTYTFTDNIYDQIVVERDNVIIEGAGKTVQGTGAYLSRGIDLSSRINVTVANATITAFYFGIYLNSSFNNRISRNSVTDYTGIKLYSSSQNVLTGNNFADDGYGVWLEISSNNTLSENDITQCDYGIFPLFSNNNSFYKNTFKHNVIGVYLYNSSDNKLVNNWMANNSISGVRLESSPSNIIVENTIANTTGSKSSTAISVDKSNNNKIYHNNFISNELWFLDQSVNQWDNGYPSGGNYWSDYGGLDVHSGPGQNLTGSDGVGDTPYVMVVNNTIDKYPLMAPFNTFDVGTWNGLMYSVDTVSNSTLINFSFNSTSRTLMFDARDTDGIVGFCRVAIPKALLSCDIETEWIIQMSGLRTPSDKVLFYQSIRIITMTDYTYIYFAYPQGVHSVLITGTQAIPELQPFMLITLLMIMTLLGAITLKRIRKVQK